MQELTFDSVLAKRNLDWLYRHEYFGSLIIASLSSDGQTVILTTAISGPSEGSRNCVYADKGNGLICTEVADSSKEKVDSALTLYPAHMETHPDIYAISNGGQTKDACRSLRSLAENLRGYSFEPDRPNFTPRITARCIRRRDEKPTFEFDIRRRDESGLLLVKNSMPVKLEPGFGLLVCTYEANRDPLPSFVGGPKLITMSDDPIPELKGGLSSIEKVAGIAVKHIPVNSGPSTVEIWNAYQKK
jgi:IMP cyclohydrolase